MQQRNNTHDVGVMSVQEASDALGVSRWTVWRRIKDGSLPAYRVGNTPGGAVRVRRRDLEALFVQAI